MVLCGFGGLIGLEMCEIWLSERYLRALALVVCDTRGICHNSETARRDIAGAKNEITGPYVA